jgi:pimeloyl-ACP methyl ester carboxylesterase
MHTLEIILTILCAGAVITQIGKVLIERAHPPRGRLIDIAGLPQHVLEVGAAEYATEAGAGSVPVVLVHGASCNLEDMRLALGDGLTGRRIIFIDRPGHGFSSRGGGRGSSPACQAAILRGILDRLGVHRAVLVGHSWGGAMVLTFALDYPEQTAGLVLLAPPLYPFRRRATWFYDLAAMPVVGWLMAQTLMLPVGAIFIGAGFVFAFLPQLPPRHYLRRAATLLSLRPATFLANARDVSHLKANLAPQVPRYGALAVPTVVITGEIDLIVPTHQHARKFAAAVPGAKLVVLSGIGHMLHHAAPGRVLEAIEEIGNVCAPDQ